MKLQFNSNIKKNQLTPTEEQFTDNSESIIASETDEHYTLDSILNYSSTNFETVRYYDTLGSSESSNKDNKINLLLGELRIIIDRSENYYFRELLNVKIRPSSVAINQKLPFTFRLHHGDRCRQRGKTRVGLFDANRSGDNSDLRLGRDGSADMEQPVETDTAFEKCAKGRQAEQATCQTDSAAEQQAFY